ncbi:MAG: hypothetical protein ACLQVD_01085 [Capsulimonadaceae bacterium]
MSLPSRVGPGVVKGRVRKHALLLQSFTLATIANVTDLKETSISTELDRMMRDGLLTSDQKKPATYTLTEDPEKRLKLSEEIFPSTTTITDTHIMPTGPHWDRAVDLIDRAQSLSGQPSACLSLLAAAREELSAAVEAAGWTNAPASVQVYLKFEGARLAFWRGLLDGDVRKPVERMIELKPFLERYHDRERLRTVRFCQKTDADLRGSGPFNLLKFIAELVASSHETASARQGVPISDPFSALVYAKATADGREAYASYSPEPGRQTAMQQTLEEYLADLDRPPSFTSARLVEV